MSSVTIQIQISYLSVSRGHCKEHRGLLDIVSQDLRTEVQHRTTAQFGPAVLRMEPRHFNATSEACWASASTSVGNFDLPAIVAETDERQLLIARNSTTTMATIILQNYTSAAVERLVITVG